jgi:hypothetical protein
MKPIGLTVKKSRNKYQRDPRGELMLIHECVECNALSINRIAADDNAGTVMAVFEESLIFGHQLHRKCQEYGILMLNAEDTESVYTQLYGRAVEIPTMS